MLKLKFIFIKPFNLFNKKNKILLNKKARFLIEKLVMLPKKPNLLISMTLKVLKTLNNKILSWIKILKNYLSSLKSLILHKKGNQKFSKKFFFLNNLI
jgi:hypothetical protein